MQRTPRILVPLFLLCLIAVPTLAQVGGMSVRVVDALDAGPLAGATVTLSSNQGLLAPTSRLTSTSGEAEFPVLRAGSGYTLRVEMPGFATYRVPDLRVRAETIERVTIQLSPEISERVEVRAELDRVDLDRTDSSSKFDDVFIENLPVPGRFYQNMLSLAPGVNDWDEDGNPNVHGARTREFSGEVGGVRNTDPLTGEWLSYVNPASIEEMEVITAGAGVEFGRASGGFARIVQRQGSNDFEGLFSFIYRSSKLDGNGASVHSGDEIPDFESLQPGILLSGRIVKDKLWFRLTHEEFDREDPVDLLTRVDIIRRDQRIVADQLTWQVSPRNKLAFEYREDPLTIENYGLSSGVSPESTQRLERGGPTWSLTWTVPQSARLLVDTVVAYQDHTMNLLPTTEGVWNGCARFHYHPGLDLGRCFNSDRGKFSGSHHETWRDQRQRFTVHTQATLHAGRFLGMPHRFKFGFLSENERYYRELERRPDIEFHTVIVPFGSPPIIGVATAQIPAPKNTTGRAVGTSWAVYAEDQFRPLDNLQVTLGLRMDREEIRSGGRLPFDPQAEADQFYQRLAEGQPVDTIFPASFTAYDEISQFQRELAIALRTTTSDVPLGPTALQSEFWYNQRRAGDIRLTNTNLSPRLSVAWDPWGDGKTKLALSAGRYYDKIFLGVPLLELEPAVATLTFNTFEPNTGAGWWGLFPRNGIDAAISAQMVDRDLRTPYQDELTFSFERMLWPETSLRVTYVRRDYEDQLQDIDINHRFGDEGRCQYSSTMGLRPTVVASPGEGQELLDPYSGEEYIDTDPGPGDGIIDDCIGDVVHLGGTIFGIDREVPDGLPDLYVLNPGWGEVLLVGNHNTTEYTAYVLELVRRQYRNWQMNASYTWSEAIGDAEDFTEIQGNEKNLVDDERGFLAYDQRHAVKISAISITPWGFRLGGTLRWESGLPYSILESKLTAFSVPLDYGTLGDKSVRTRLRYPTGTRNDQRNPSFWTFDLRLAKEFDLPGGTQLQATAEIFNVFNDNTLRLENSVNGTVTGVRRFGRQFQLGLRYSF